MHAHPCLTEVFLPATTPFLDTHQRLHRYLPSSPYSSGAVYALTQPIVDSPFAVESKQANAIQSPSPPPTLLLLRGDFKFRSSAVHEKVSEEVGGPLDSWYDYSTVRRLVHCPPADSLAHRQFAFSVSASSLQLGQACAGSSIDAASLVNEMEVGAMEQDGLDLSVAQQGKAVSKRIAGWSSSTAFVKTEGNPSASSPTLLKRALLSSAFSLCSQSSPTAPMTDSSPTLVMSPMKYTSKLKKPSCKSNVRQSTQRRHNGLQGGPGANPLKSIG